MLVKLTVNHALLDIFSPVLRLRAEVADWCHENLTCWCLERGWEQTEELDEDDEPISTVRMWVNTTEEAVHFKLRWGDGG